jgi:FkbM family methyltransferase
VTSIALPPEQAWTFARLATVLAARHVDPFSVLHVGAHHGEEVPAYRACGFTRITLVEPDPRNVAVLRERFDHDPDVFIIAAACVSEVTSRADRATLHQAERTVWSGLVPHTTATGATVDVATVTPDDVLGNANVLVLDTQGTELALLAASPLHRVDLIIIETSRRAGDTAAYHDDVLTFMHGRGWELAEEWVHDDSGYHDAVFVRRPS